MTKIIYRLSAVALLIIGISTAYPVNADWCYGTGGGSTGGACAEYTGGSSQCTSTICSSSVSGTTANDAGSGCAAGTSCTSGAADASNDVSESECSCTCFDSTEACAASLNPPTVAYTTTLVNPLGSANDVSQISARVIQMITGITGSLALLMFVWGGFLWTTSAGNDEKVKKAKQIFTQSVLGLAIIFGAYAILTAVLKAFTGAAT